MECKEAEHLIQKYVKNELEGNKVEELVDHLRTCNSCMEEISIVYLVQEGLRKLESGDTFDLNKELQNKMDSSLRKIRIQKHLRRGLIFLIVLLAIFIGVLLFMFM